MAEKKRRRTLYEKPVNADNHFNCAGRSMLERLMEWDIYRKNENNKFNPSYVTKLVQNYRCHGSILHVPNLLFYEGELKVCGGFHTQRACTWRRLPKPDFPVIFHAVEGKEKRISQSPRWKNTSWILNSLDEKIGFWVTIRLCRFYLYLIPVSEIESKTDNPI